VDPGAAGTFGFAVFRGAAIVFAMMVMAYPIYRVVGLYFDRALNANETVLYLTALLFLFLGIIVGWGSPLGWMLMAALLVGCLGLPVINRLADRIALRRMEDDDIRKFAETLQKQPRNTYLHERLARIFLGRREYELALSHAKQANEISPEDPAFKRLVERIQTEQRRDEQRLKLCPKCFAENPPGAGACLKCGFHFLDPADFLRLLWAGPALEAIKWSGLAMMGAGLVLLVGRVSMLGASLLMMLGIASLFWYMYAVFGRR